MYTLTIPERFDAYWVGFLLGDGCVYRQDGQPRGLKVQLHSRDREHLEKLKRYLHTDIPIRTVPPNDRTSDEAVYLKVSRIAIAERLIEQGINPNKSLSATVPNGLEWDRDFWRGLLDADGTIGLVENKPYLALYGTYDVCESFIAYVKKVFGESFTKRKPYKNRTIYKAAFSKRAARRILKHLYQEDDMVLDRKAVLAKEFQKG
jgi:hypothetical protein